MPTIGALLQPVFGNAVSMDGVPVAAEAGVLLAPVDAVAGVEYVLAVLDVVHVRAVAGKS